MAPMPSDVTEQPNCQHPNPHQDPVSRTRWQAGEADCVSDPQMKGPHESPDPKQHPAKGQCRLCTPEGRACITPCTAGAKGSTKVS